jgi:HPt (histidine-containing phosphotransfer) domain-containing protein
VHDSGNDLSKTPALGDPLVTVDPLAIERLQRLGGAKLVERMIGLFVEHVEARIADAREARAEGRPGDVERAAHSVKSSAGNLGAMELYAVADRIEGLSQAGDGDAAGGLIPALESAFARARARLDEYRRELRT